MLFEMLNFLTGVFCEKASETVLKDRDFIIQRQEEQTHATLAAFKEIFLDMDADGDGLISYEEFEEHIQSHRVMMYLMSEGLNLLEPKQVFKLFHENGSPQGHPDGYLDLDSFLLGVFRVIGQARNTDVALMHAEVRVLTSRLHEFLDASRVSAPERSDSWQMPADVAEISQWQPSGMLPVVPEDDVEDNNVRKPQSQSETSFFPRSDQGVGKVAAI